MRGRVDASSKPADTTFAYVCGFEVDLEVSNEP